MNKHHAKVPDDYPFRPTRQLSTRTPRGHFVDRSAGVPTRCPKCSGFNTFRQLWGTIFRCSSCGLEWHKED